MSRFLGLLGVVLTGFYLWFAISDSVDGYDQLGLNERGDFLAGVVSPIALLWLVLGYFLQRLELRASRDALLLQAKELKNAVEISEQQLQSKINEIKVERFKAQPFFYIQHGPANINSKAEIDQSFKLRNYRHQALDVRVEWEGELCIDLDSMIPSIDGDGVVEFCIRTKPEKVQNFLFHLEFIDGMGERKSTSFIFERDESSRKFPIYMAKRIDGNVVHAG